VSGTTVQNESFLGILLGLGPTRDDTRELAMGAATRSLEHVQRHNASKLKALAAQIKNAGGNQSASERANSAVAELARELGEEPRGLVDRILLHLRTGEPLETKPLGAG